MPESPREEKVYADKGNIVAPHHTLDDVSVPAAARTQQDTKDAAELTAMQTRATAQGASGTIVRAKK